jgi:hypothetical protein
MSSTADSDAQARKELLAPGAGLHPSYCAGDPVLSDGSIVTLPVEDIDVNGQTDEEVLLHGHHHKGHGATVEEEAAAGVVALRRAIFTTIPLFMGYAGMVMLQANVKRRIGIKDGDAGSQLFSTGAGCLYIGNLLFRLLHNVLFTFLTPRQRVMLSYTLMIAAQLTLGLAYFVFNLKTLVFVFVAYGLAGVAIGSFESNLISSITPLGHGTKSWAVIGIPIGFNGVSVGFFALFAIWPGNVWLQGGAYFFIALANLLGLVFFVVAIPAVEFGASHDNIRKFIEDAKAWRIWFPTIWKHSVALMIDMFGVSLFSAVALYIFDLDEIPIYPGSDVTVPRNAFQMVYNFCAFLGDFSARKIAYMDKSRNPFFYLVLMLCGAALVLSKTALVAPIGMFFVMFCNGSIYAQSTRHVDNEVDDRFNLIGLSIWLFVGDIGSVAGSQLVHVVRQLVGPV